jgi:hypothetical protein
MVVFYKFPNFLHVSAGKKKKGKKKKKDSENKDWSDHSNFSDELPLIAIMAATTTRKINNPSTKSLSLFTYLLPSLVRTLDCGYRYEYVMGYDKGDPFYDSEKVKLLVCLLVLCCLFVCFCVWFLLYFCVSLCGREGDFSVTQCFFNVCCVLVMVLVMVVLLCVCVYRAWQRCCYGSKTM